MLSGKIGNYDIIEKIGAGGMGEVYRARDTRLGRDVALKLLPEAFSADADRLGRFEREARLLAALNHPNIGAIYGLEHHGDRRFLVLELVAGEDLSARIARGAIPLDEALPIAREIAEALEFAHEQGIVHRDLKPANIKITPEGRVKVLDFGLAKALEGDEGVDPRLSQSPTVLASSPTVAGVILGTAAYMSPEQARGKSVDKRSDVFAFGCVLYEMLTGQQAFSGDTVSDTLAAVLKTQPDAGALPPEAPRAIRELLKRCLEKDAKLRLRDIGEARIAIDRARHAEPDEAPAAAGTAASGSNMRANLVWGVATLAIAAAAFFASRVVTPPPAGAPLRKLTIHMDEAETSASLFRLALSPDGTRIAYIHDDRLWVRDLSKLEPQEIAGTERAEIPFWSPDGTQVGYRVGSTFYRVGAGGGQSTVISATGESFTGGAGVVWTPDDRIVFTTGNKGLLVVPALGGDPVVLLAKETTEVDIHEPSALPDGRGFLFVPHLVDGGPNSIAVYAAGKRKTLLTLKDQRIWEPRYASTGHILFRRTPINAGIWALPFSLSKLEVTGEPFLVALDGAEPCPGPDGLLVYRAGSEQGHAQFAWIAPDGTLEETVSEVYDVVGSPAIAPDGVRLAGVVNETSNNNGDIWVFDLTRGTRTRLTFDPAWEIQPVWSPDGKLLYYVETKDGTIRVRTADGTGEERVLMKGWEPSISPDGKWLLFDADDLVTASSDVFLVPLPVDTTVAPTKLVATKKGEWGGRVSPSGDYVVYGSDESGRDEIYLTRFPSGEGKWQVSVGGGDRPRWDPAGGKLFFTTDTELMEVTVTTKPALALGNPKPLFKFSDAHVIFGRTSSYDVARGGKRFMMAYDASAASEHPQLTIALVENWTGEFRKTAKK